MSVKSGSSSRVAYRYLPCLVAASSLLCLKACAVVRPQVLSCELLVNLLEDGRSIFEIRTIGQLCLEAKAESLARGTRKEGPEARPPPCSACRHSFFPQATCPIGGAATVWSR
jgi:hypothetical protein